MRLQNLYIRSLVHYNDLQFQNLLGIVVHLPSGLMYVMYSLY